MTTAKQLAHHITPIISVEKIRKKSNHKTMVKLSSLLQVTPLLTAVALTDAKRNVRGRSLHQKQQGTIVSDINTVESLKPDRLFYPYESINGCLANGIEIQQKLKTNGLMEVADMFFYPDLDSCCQAHFKGSESCLQVGTRHEQEDLNVVTEALSHLKPARRLHSSYAKQYTYYHGKSGKGSKGGKSGKGGKGSSGKSGKSHSHTGGWHHHHHHKHKKTQKPSSKNIGLMPDPDDVAVTMGGLLMAHKIQAPPTGSDDMLAVAESFEKTISRVLEPGFTAEVSSVCESSVRKRMLGEVGDGPVCEVVFDLVTHQPCRGCDDMGMLIMGAQVFEETYETLNRAAESGELETIFCIYAGAAGVANDPCVTTISSVEGTSLDVSRGERTPTTPRPSKIPAPTAPNTPAPITMGWMPTPPPVSLTAPTESPVQETRPPVGTVPTAPPMMDPTSLPPMEGSVEPTYFPSSESPVSASSFPTPSGDVTLPPIQSAPPQAGGVPTLPPASGTMPTGPPVTLSPVTESPSSQGGKPGEGSEEPTYYPSYIPSMSPVTGDATSPPAVPTPPPMNNVVPTMPPADTSSTPTYYPSYVPTGANETSPPVLPTLPPMEGVVPTMPPASASVPTLPPGNTLPPVMSSLAPVMSSMVPTVANTALTLAPSVGNQTSSDVPTIANRTSMVPTVANISTSFVPTTSSNDTDGPSGALYFEGFEGGEFPVAPWTTEGEEPWAIDTERVRTGTYSIKSGSLDLIDTVQKNSNVTFITNSDWPDGMLVLSIFAGVQLPIDDFLFFVDGQFRGQVTGRNEWSLLKIPLPPGSHTVLFSYKSNPLGLVELPPSSPTHIGAVYLDNVYYLPAGITVAPTMVSFIIDWQ